jgi:outer membrane protein
MTRALAAMALLLAATALSGETLTVDQAVEAALAHNVNVRNARLEVEKAETRIAAARTNRLPALSFSAIGGEALNNLSIEIEDGPGGETTRVDLARTFNMFAIARITQPITQQHAIGLGIKLNEAQAAVDKERERAARLAVTREVKSAYFAVLSAKSYTAALRDAVTAWEEVEREMIVRVSQKAALEADRLDATARLASTKLAALSAENALATANDQLTYLVGREIEVIAAPFEPITDITNAIDRPDLREAALRVEQARLDLRLKHAERIPDVALVLSSTTPINSDVLPSNMTSAGLTISYEPFTWGRRKLELTEKRHAVAQAEHALRDKQSMAAVEIAALRRKVAESAAQVAVRRIEVEAAQERLRVVKARFQTKAARPDEMFNAGASLTNAAAREQEAVSAYWTARADYEQAIGEE